MVKYTLVYFDGRGRAEVCRILFALADVEYEDKRIQGADWGKLKPETPFGQMPILKLDDITLCQSDAMEFYLAKTFGFAGSNTLEEAQVLMMGACVLDTLTPLFKMYGLKEEEAKDEIRKKYETEQMPKFLGNLQKMLVSNKGGDGYFIGDKISVADLKIATILDTLTLFGIKCDLNEYPKLKAHNERVMSEPKIAAWVAKRPESTF
ncbi:S-crystallin SL11 [Lamellibrachia satsuma]|nr:S-crystallin SL11 [Lamellibrachia satsuma]